MSLDPKFQALVSDLSSAALSGDQQRAQERRLDAEGLTAAKKVFEPIRQFLNKLELALEQAVGSQHQVVENFWMVGPEREIYSAHYRIASQEVAFFVSADFQRLTFVQQNFAASDVAAIEKAIKEWVIETLQQ